MATTVSSKTTDTARFVSAVAYFVGLLVTWGILPADTAGDILGFIEGELFNAIVLSVLFTITTILPAVQKWRSRERELPDGVTILDVDISPDAPNPAVKADVLASAKADSLTALNKSPE